MTEEDIEAAYEALAEKIDEIGQSQSEIYLAKLALLLSKEVGDLPTVLACISGAALSLDSTA